jgi:gluconate 2-dehydrogenase gamma chain
MINELGRRRFLSQAGIGVSAAWVSVHWPEMVSAATHAHQAVQSGVAYKFEFFTPAEVTEIDALSARIIPTDDTPGAREAGALYFIDRALVTFASGDQQKYRDGLVDLQSAVREKFPGAEKFSGLTPEQQDNLLHAVEASQTAKAPRRGRVNSGQTFLEALRVQTIAGFLIDPEAGTGNRGGVGWKLIGREPAHSFQPPFGYYDKDYPGWQPAPKMADKK